MINKKKLANDWALLHITNAEELGRSFLKRGDLKVWLNLCRKMRRAKNLERFSTPDLKAWLKGI